MVEVIGRASIGTYKRSVEGIVANGQGILAVISLIEKDRADPQQLDLLFANIEAMRRSIEVMNKFNGGVITYVASKKMQQDKGRAVA